MCATFLTKGQQPRETVPSVSLSKTVKIEMVLYRPSLSGGVPDSTEMLAAGRHAGV